MTLCDFDERYPSAAVFLVWRREERHGTWCLPQGPVYTGESSRYAVERNLNAEVGHGWGPFLTSEAMRTHLSADVFAAVKPQDTSIPFAPSNPDASIEARWFEIGSLHALRNLHPRAAAILLSDPGGTPWEQWEQHALLKSHPLPEHGSGGGARGGGGATGGGGSSTTDGASGVKVESGGGATAGGAAGGGGATSGGGGAGAAGAFGEEVLLRAAPKRRRGSGWGSGAGAEVRAGPHFLQQAHFLHVEIEALEFHFLHVETEALELDLHSVTQRPSRHRQQTSKFERYSEDEDDWEVERARIAQRRRREGAQRREGAMGGGRTN